MTRTMSAVKNRLLRVLALVTVFALCLGSSFGVYAVSELPSVTTKPDTQAETEKATEATTQEKEEKNSDDEKETNEDSSEKSDSQEEESTQVPVEETTDDEYQKLQDEYDALEKEMQANQDKLNQVQSSLDKQEQVVDGINTQISDTQNQVNLLATRYKVLLQEKGNTEAQIALLSEQLGTLSGQIDEVGTAISENEEALAQTYELLKQRIRAMYMAGSGSTLEFLLTSEDFSTLLTRTELLVRVAEHDNNLMATLEEDIALLGELESQLSMTLDEQESKRSALDTKNQALANSSEDLKITQGMLADKQEQLEEEMKAEKAELNSLDKESDEYKALISKQEDELIALSAQMEEYIKNVGSSSSDKTEEDKDSEEEEPSGDNPYMDGTETVYSSGMIFPLKCSGVYITSPYGMRTHPVTGEYKLHTGTDFSAGGINGKTVYAVKDGEVIYSQKHKAYGNFVIIDHGNGISSCYAHMQDNSVTVAVGDKVLQGQPIGRVGSTGYSTGAHLHFEIRVDGKTTDPMGGYIKLP